MSETAVTGLSEVKIRVWNYKTKHLFFCNRDESKTNFPNLIPQFTNLTNLTAWRWSQSIFLSWGWKKGVEI